MIEVGLMANHIDRFDLCHRRGMSVAARSDNGKCSTGCDLFHHPAT